MRKLVNAVLGAVATVAAVADGGLPGSTTPAATDRTAVERIYYEHRLGTKPAFEQALPPAQIEKMVKLDLKKEIVLRRVYKIDIKQPDVDGEVQRIDSTTRAPEVLNEIKAALGNDPKRFADTVARPILVERKLRAQFQNDAKLHAPQREQAEQARKKVLAAKDANKRIALLKAVAAVADRGPRSTTSATTSKGANVNEVTWQLTPRQNAATVAGVADPGSSAGPRSTTSATAADPGPRSTTSATTTDPGAASATPATVIASSKSYSIKATTQVAQVLSSPEKEKDTKFYFEDLDPELQKVLHAQLQKSGDVSAVIEAPTAFLLFVAKEKANDALSVASLSIPKRSYDEWLSQQPDKTS